MRDNDYIVPNLTFKEVYHSVTATIKGIDNKPTEGHFENIKAIAENVFKPLREFVDSPIIITSFYRSEKLNQAIKGAKSSQHTKGEAIDLKSKTVSNKVLFDYIKNNLDFDQLIWEFGTEFAPQWVHVSYKKDGNNRKEVLKAIKQDGKTKYLKIS